MRSFSRILIVLALFCSTAHAQDEPNFYLPAPAKKEPAKAESSPRTVSRDRIAPPGSKIRPVTPEDRIFKLPDIKLQVRKINPDQRLDPPLDPYGIAKAFKNRWDFSSFIISPEEELAFRLDNARRRTLRLARAFTALSDEVEIRQRNLDSAALAAYLLSRDQQTWVPIEGHNLTAAQMLAVQATMRQDIAALQGALHDYETLRTSLNAAASEITKLEEQEASMKRRRAAGLQPSSLPLQPNPVVARDQMATVLDDQSVELETLKAELAAQDLRRMGGRRQSIASFAPPPPGFTEPRDSANRILEMPAADVEKEQPRGALLERPRHQVMIFETEINAPVLTPRKGVVAYAGPFRGHGTLVIIEHEDSVHSIYSYLGTLNVRERQVVQAGQMLGRAGIPPEINRSGIHFQVLKNKTPVDPQKWLGIDEPAHLLTQGAPASP